MKSETLEPKLALTSLSRETIMRLERNKNTGSQNEHNGSTEA